MDSWTVLRKSSLRNVSAVVELRRSVFSQTCLLDQFSAKHSYWPSGVPPVLSTAVLSWESRIMAKLLKYASFVYALFCLCLSSEE